MSQDSDDNGYRRGRPGVPTGLVVASVIIALLAVSGLILLLYEETRGPGEVLRQFARAVDDRDCGSSYDLLDASVRSGLDGSTWCEQVLPAVDGQIDADFDLDRAVLQGNEAEVHVSGVEVEVWRLRRFGERSWRVLGPEAGFPIPA
jgi:hypothetical protein